MSLFHRFLLVGLLSLVPMAACTQEKPPPTPSSHVHPMFDPISNPAQVPTPTDLVRNQDTGQLQIPTDPKNDPPAQHQFNQYLNTLNGYPTTVTPEVRFSAALDPASITAETIRVYDATYSWPTLIEGLTFQYQTIKSSAADGKQATEQGLVRIWNPKGWTRGHLYVVYVLGGTAGVKDAKGKPIGRSDFFQMVAQPNALCDWDRQRNYNVSNNSCDLPVDGATAAGCCRTPTSLDLRAIARNRVIDAYGSQSQPTSDILHQETTVQTRRLGSTLEKIRQGYNQLLALSQVAGLNPDNVALTWNFTIASNNEAIFDPTGTSPAIPLPSDLLLDNDKGVLNIPIAKDAAPAEKDFTGYLNTLNGWPLSSSTATVSFQHPIANNQLDKGVAIYAIKGNQATLVTKRKLTYDKNAKQLSIQILETLQPRTTYAIVALGGKDGLKNADGNSAPGRSAMMQLVLSEDPLCTCKGITCQLDKKEICDTVTVSSFIDDPKSFDTPRTAIDKAMLFEEVRQGYDDILTIIEKTSQIVRGNVISMWSFTTANMSEVTFDPTTGVIPYPNDLLLDATTGKVNIPAPDNETPEAKKLREGLNKLDGFTTLGSYYATYVGELDKDSVKLGTSVFIYNLKTGKAVTDWRVEVMDKASAIVASPDTPLNEQTQYGIVMLSASKDGGQKASSGLKDKNGNRIAASSFMALVRSAHPLYADGKSTISSLSNETAKAAESARQTFSGLFALVDKQGIARTDVVAAWTFTTQSITKPLTELRTLPWQQLTKTDQGSPQWTGSLIPVNGQTFPAIAPRDQLATWVPNGHFVSWLAIDETGTRTFLSDPTKGKPINVPMALIIPKSPMPNRGYPVAIFSHGLGRAKSDVVAIANTLASKGIATIAFDTLYHGARSLCTKDQECTQGSCNTKTGKCNSGTLKDSDDNGIPDASSERFLPSDNPFAIRDNIRQHVIDVAALIRGITSGAASGIKDASGTAGTIRLDPQKVYYVGQSLGGILGSLVLATDSIIKRGVLNVPGAPLVDIIATSPGFKDRKDAIYAAQNVKPGTLAELRLLTTFKWILDPADPANFAKYIKDQSLPDLITKGKVPAKDIMVMLAGNDQTIPVALGQNLARLIDLPAADMTRSTYPNAGHIFLLFPDPAGEIGATLSAQQQVGNFFLTGTVCKPNTSNSTCQ
jgi:dienelactone hydrolase